MKDATHSMQLGRRGFSGAVDHPGDDAVRRRRVLSSAAILTYVLVTISIAELTWILVR